MKYDVHVRAESGAIYHGIDADSYDEAEQIAKDKFYSDNGYFDEVHAEAELLEGEDGGS